MNWKQIMEAKYYGSKGNEMDLPAGIVAYRKPFREEMDDTGQEKLYEARNLSDYYTDLYAIIKSTLIYLDCGKRTKYTSYNITKAQKQAIITLTRDLYNALTPTQRKIMIYYLVHKFTQSDIAKRLSISSAGVFKHITLIQRKVQKCFIKCNPFLSDRYKDAEDDEKHV